MCIINMGDLKRMQKYVILYDDTYYNDSFILLNDSR